MELPFDIEGSMTISDAKNYSLKLLWVGFKYVITFLSILAVINIVSSIRNNNSIVHTLSFLLTPFLAFIFIWIAAQIMGSVMYKKKKEQFESMHYTFDENEIKIKAIGFESKVAWSTYSKAKEDSKFIILYQGKVPTNLISKSFFKNEYETQEFLKIANEKMKTA